MSKDALRNGSEVDMMKSMIAGGMSGVVARLFTAPLDVLKISAQLKPRNKIISIQETHPLNTHKRANIEIFKKDGIPGFFKGNVPGMVMYLLYGSVQFSTYSFLNSRLKLFDASFSEKYYESINSMIIGGLSGVTACVATYPLDILKTRFVAVANKNKTNIFKETIEIWKYENGIRGLFKGCTASIGTFGLSTAIMFSTYEALRIYTEKNKEFKFISPFISAITGVTAKTVTFPLDTVRRRLQIMQAKNLQKLTSESEIFQAYKSKKTFFNIGKQIIRTEGLLALYQGLPMALVKSAPTTAISLSVYQYIINNL
ncbi:mitochondrial carrier [Hanseniaspora valbyensis NRRL Y-1626]|uniref:Mitochondrial carrier n=1 Tax=Hanseniaspora valbyensis NRRL Y-1626 TaxID=766949 RepID=A0A1B7TFW8_9ASCO|nr:mitochondrial carrier [Hanseniaspora valbyensis NRRL Y-1626]